ncbi:hypothetical protein SBA2_670028 [Acidobacteriia bacterium SbA2]|nr:hypothetical protein SBA2_670028 [Acidobacteriia bacterium SbA2]
MTYRSVPPLSLFFGFHLNFGRRRRLDERELRSSAGGLLMGPRPTLGNENRRRPRENEDPLWGRKQDGFQLSRE